MSLTGAIGAGGTGGVRNQQQAAKPRELDKQAFLQLLVTQMRYQNPLEPMDNKEYVAQLAQFSSLEQMQAMARNIESMAAGREQAEQMNATLKEILAVQRQILARMPAALNQTA